MFRQHTDGLMTAYGGLYYCNNMKETSWGKRIWGEGKRNPKAYRIVPENRRERNNEIIHLVDIPRSQKIIMQLLSFFPQIYCHQYTIYNKVS